ncbi:NapC/NirT family cytochrome c [Conservatibacter flavescens]|uniref:Cytochrome c-type protein n=1 Tax=Conservatibacter flavescens TaxID=28161 RepID=A0A2M8S510_9PAST|nr:NapC/NirT family cytochrome c [Conservatibacter flavescens]PJG86229.1 cytochrome C [Conservatibacter flavescens]
MIKKFWRWFRTPSRIAVGTLLTLAFIAGIVFWGGFNTALEYTNTEEFCSDCHMNDVVPEYRMSVHYNNRSGVKADCADCHLPHDFVGKWTRKIVASREVYAHIMGHVDTKEKFEAARLEMAQREWARMKANDSAECRYCHNFNDMDYTQQKTVAEKMHRLAQEEGKTCIDCHKGIAHQLPNMHGVKSGFTQSESKDEKK